jgi:hypothetical protein
MARDWCVPHRSMPGDDREDDSGLFEIVDVDDICEIGVRPEQQEHDNAYS